MLLFLMRVSVFHIRRIIAGLITLSILPLLSGCSGDQSTPSPSPLPSTTPLTFTPNTRALDISTTEGDRLLTVVTSGDRYYAAGWTALDGDSRMIVARFDQQGALDPTFGNNGVATINVAVGGGTAELARGVIVQSDGKIVIAGPVEHDPRATGDAVRDTDIAVVRFDTTGHIDPTFGTDGITRLDLSTGVLNETTFRGDTSWGVTLLPDDAVLVVGGKVAEGVDRKDLDYAVVKLTTNGTLDTEFGTNGLVTLDVGQGGSAQPRTALIQPDNKIVVSGHSDGTDDIVSVDLFRLLPNGQFDATFGANGIVHTALGLAIAEAYDVALQGDNLVITGYGRLASATTVNILTARFHADGSLDTTFGDGGKTLIDVASEHDRSRKLEVLSDGHLLIAGQGKPTATTQDGALVLLTPNGQRETRLNGTGVALLDFGGPTDALFGLALAPDKKSGLAVGWKGADNTLPVSPTNNDDARVAQFSVPTF